MLYVGSDKLEDKAAIADGIIRKITRTVHLSSLLLQLYFGDLLLMASRKATGRHKERLLFFSFIGDEHEEF